MPRANSTVPDGRLRFKARLVFLWGGSNRWRINKQLPTGPSCHPGHGITKINPMTLVRPASDADAYGVAQVHVASWKVTYRGMAPDDYLNNLKALDRVSRWRERIANKTDFIFVAEVDDVIVGFASYFIHEQDSTAELDTIYLDPDHWRHGVGTQLVHVVMTDMTQKGCDTAVLWVHPSNDRARNFYEHLGWQVTGKTKTEPSWGQQMPAIQYGRSLTPAP
jgi:ribosomal protein S18 acetylase RimI-like enzyme